MSIIPEADPIIVDRRVLIQHILEVCARRPRVQFVPGFASSSQPERIMIAVASLGDCIKVDTIIFY